MQTPFTGELAKLKAAEHARQIATALADEPDGAMIALLVAHELICGALASIATGKSVDAAIRQAIAVQIDIGRAALGFSAPARAIAVPRG